jgi:hypothetical protein
MPATQRPDKKEIAALLDRVGVASATLVTSRASEAAVLIPIDQVDPFVDFITGRLAQRPGFSSEKVRLIGDVIRKMVRSEASHFADIAFGRLTKADRMYPLTEAAAVNVLARFGYEVKSATRAIPKEPTGHASRGPRVIAVTRSPSKKAE